MDPVFMKPVQSHVFKAIQDLDIPTLMQCPAEEIRPILPCLVRMALISPLDTTQYCSEAKKDILTLLSGIDLVNFLVNLLSIEFHTLEVDFKKEQQIKLVFLYLLCYQPIYIIIHQMTMFLEL